MCLLDHGGGGKGPGEVFEDVDSQELEVGDTFYLRPGGRVGG